MYQLTIVQLISDISTVGGGQTLVANLSIALSKKTEHKIFVVSLYKERQSPVVDLLKKHGVSIIYLDKHIGVDFKCAKQLKRVLKELKPDIVHAHLSTYTTLYLSGVCNKFKVFYTFHSVVSSLNKESSSKLNDYVLRKLIKRNKMTPIAISQTVKETIEDHFKILNVPVVENGVDIKRFMPPKDVCNRKYDFIVVGSFSKVKNQISILEMLNQIIENNNPLTAVFLGDGELLSECQKYTSDNQLEKLITFKGNVGDVENYLKESSCLVMNSLYEGNPMVINEAIACGTYVISNDVGGIKDIVRDSNGYLVKEQKDFVNVLVYYMKHKTEIMKKIQINLDENRRNVSIDLTAEKYINVFFGVK